MRTAGFALAFLALAIGGSSTVKAWGIEGHQIVADIAEKHLTPEAAKRVAEILQGARMRDGRTTPIKSGVRPSTRADGTTSISSRVLPTIGLNAIARNKTVRATASSPHSRAPSMT